MSLPRGWEEKEAHEETMSNGSGSASHMAGLGLPCKEYQLPPPLQMGSTAGRELLKVLFSFPFLGRFLS